MNQPSVENGLPDPFSEFDRGLAEKNPVRAVFEFPALEHQRAAMPNPHAFRENRERHHDLILRDGRLDAVLDVSPAVSLVTS